MITDKVSEYQRYLGISERLDKALKLMAETDFAALSTGHHEFFDGVAINVFETETKLAAADSKWEAHRDYIDIHVGGKTGEKIFYRHRDDLKEVTPYDAEADAAYYVNEGAGGGAVTIFTGDFAICFPEDAHLPVIAVDQPEQHRKTVMKVRVD